MTWQKRLWPEARRIFRGSRAFLQGSGRGAGRRRLEEKDGQEGGRAADEGKEARLRSGGKGTRHCGGRSTPGETLHVERQQSGGAALP